MQEMKDTHFVKKPFTPAQDLLLSLIHTDIQKRWLFLSPQGIHITHSLEERLG